jgi:hypothetical protein
MLLLTSTLLLVDNNTNNTDDVDNIDDVNDVNNADIDDTNDERRRKSSIEEKKESRLDTSLDRVERLVMCYFFASLAVSEAESNNTTMLEKSTRMIKTNRVLTYLHFDVYNILRVFYLTHVI